MIVRQLYYQKRQELYSEGFQKKLYFAYSNDPEWYSQNLLILYQIMGIVENSILRGQLSRSVRYFSVMACYLNKIEKKIQIDMDTKITKVLGKN